MQKSIGDSLVIIVSSAGALSLIPPWMRTGELSYQGLVSIANPVFSDGEAQPCIHRAEKKSIYSPISMKDREKSNAMCGLNFMSFFKAEIACK